MDEPFLSTRLSTHKATSDGSSETHFMLLEFPSFASLDSSLPRRLSSTMAAIASCSGGGLARPERRNPHRSYSAPSMFTDTKGDQHRESAGNSPSLPLKPSSPFVWFALLGFIIYILFGATLFMVRSSEFKGDSTKYKIVDALYFCVVTLCTIGYGDIVPSTNLTKLFTCILILAGFAILHALLTGVVTYVLNQQESLLLSAMEADARNVVFKTYVVDMSKGRMRIRMKVCLALCVVVFCIALGTVSCRVLEGLSWVDSVYLSVTSVTTVGYGDYAFGTWKGRLFASVWLLVSTLAVARAFLYLTELRVEKRNRLIAKWVLQKEMTPSDLLAADRDNNGFISKSEFVIYKLKEMGKIGEKDILQICDQFNRLDTTKCGKITLTDLMENHQ